MHEMHLANNFSIRHQLGRKWGWLCVIIAQNEGTEICDKNHKTHWFNWSLSSTEAAKLKNCSPGNAARRLDCPAFRRALETGQTNRRNRNLYGDALTGRF